MREPIPVELLEKYINGTCSLKEAEKVRNWYLSFEDDADHVSAIGPDEEHALQEKIYSHILSNIGRQEVEEEIYEPPVKTSRSRILRAVFGVTGTAAAVAILSVGAVFFYRSQKAKMAQATDTTADRLMTVTNNTGQIYKVTLPDNSSVWLDPLAQLTYPKTFGAKSRVVSISGECFFEVTKNPARPFIINSRAIVTKVWGTSFLVKDDERTNSAEVSVMTGKVSVSLKKQSDDADYSTLKLERGEIMLYPHQKVVCLVDQHILKPQTEKHAEPELQIWKRVNMLFENKPLKDIIPVLNANYHVNIKAGSERLNHFILNADMEGFNLPDVLEALKKSLNVNYEIKDDVIELE